MTTPAKTRKPTHGPSRSQKGGLLLIAFALAIPLSATPAGATQPGERGRIAFAHAATDGAGSDGDIATIEPDGSGYLRLTDNDMAEYEPAWSPFGDHIAFTRVNTATELRDLWMMDADGSDQTLVFAAPGANVTSPTWSPNGQRLAFAAGGELWIGEPTGTPTPVPIDLDVVGVDWSPNGNILAISANQGVWLAASDGSGLTRIATGGRGDWSPDGSRLVYEGVIGGKTGTAIVNADGSGAVFVGDLVEGEPPGAMIRIGFDPTWSPDGSEIIFNGLLGAGIGAIRPDGSGSRVVYADSPVYEPAWQPLLPTSGFSDVLDAHVHTQSIAWLGAQEITKGCASHLGLRFCPNQPVTRGEVAAFLVRAFNYPASNDDAFADDGESIFENDINALAAAGVTKGCAEDSYCPSRSLSRAEAASMLVRALGLTTGAGTDVFADDDRSVHENNIDRLAAAGLTAGCAPDLYCPGRLLTRSEFATFLYRARSLLPGVVAAAGTAG